MKEKDCGLEIKEVERKFDMCLDVSRSISISLNFSLLSSFYHLLQLSLQGPYCIKVFQIHFYFISWDQSSRIE